MLLSFFLCIYKFNVHYYSLRCEWTNGLSKLLRFFMLLAHIGLSSRTHCHCPMYFGQIFSLTCSFLSTMYVHLYTYICDGMNFFLYIQLYKGQLFLYLVLLFVKQKYPASTRATYVGFYLMPTKMSPKKL